VHNAVTDTGLAVRHPAKNEAAHKASTKNTLEIKQIKTNA
jgi:hypothetical protein